MADVTRAVERWKEQFSKGMTVKLPLHSRDMEPLVMSGEVVIFCEANLMDIVSGDLILLYHRGNARLRQVKERNMDAGGERFRVMAVNIEDSLSEHSFADILAIAVSIECEDKMVWKRGEPFWLARLRRFFYKKRKN